MADGLRLIHVGRLRARVGKAPKHPGKPHWGMNHNTLTPKAEIYTVKINVPNLNITQN